MNSALDIAQSVIHYPQVVTVAQLALGIVLALLIIVLLAHILHSIGRRTILYRAKPPVKNWSKRFYPTIILMFVLISGLLLWLQYYSAHL